MRLTLRTLLAWLDDTLPPAEVRQIGQLVNESPFAKDLVDRIQKVSRQRRLTIPPSTGPEAIEAAVVASYLDNELSPEAVAELEKRCLTSPVHLAEVASVHQILSLIGQKAKVPPEARHRMYHLVSGRERVSAKVPRAFAPVAEPAAAVVPPWRAPAAPRKSALERYGPAAAVVGLIGVLAWAAQAVVGPGEAGGTRAVVETPAVVEPKADVAKVADVPTPKVEPPKEATPEPSTAMPAAVEPPKGDRGPVPLPVDALAVVGDGESLSFRAEAGGEAPRWERLAPRSTLKDGDRVATLAPSRAKLALGERPVELIGPAEVRIKAVDGKPRLELTRGRALLKGISSTPTMLVDFGGGTLSVEVPSSGLVGVERLDHRPPGEPNPAVPSLRIHLAEGRSIVKAGDVEATLVGPGSVEFLPPSRLGPVAAGAAAAWVGDPRPSAVEEQLGKSFGRLFAKSPRLLTALQEGMDDDEPEVGRLAIRGLVELTGPANAVATLSAPGVPAARRAAIAALRDEMARSPAAVREVAKALKDAYGDPRAGLLDKLLLGYTPAEVKREGTYSELVRLLGSKEPADVGVRELALESLQELTRRDTLGYDPDKPEGPGLKAWQDLLAQKALAPKDPR